MSFRRAATVTSTCTFLFASAALIAAGCGGGSSSPGGTGGSTGTGGHGTGGHGTGGHSATGGATGAGGLTGAGGSAMTRDCLPLPADPTMPLLMDFSDMTSTTFGNQATVFSGALSMYTGAVDVSTGAWKISQDVTGYGNTGARMDFLPCNKADLSAFTGIAFDVAGVITPMTAGVDAGTIPANQLFFQVSTAQDDVASNFDGQNNFAPSWGTCTPIGNPPNQYDGTCTSPSVTVPFAPGPTLVTKSFLWTQIAGGKGQPDGRATPDPTQLTRLNWVFPYNGVVPFHIELTIDNIRLLTGTTPPPIDAAVTDAGTDAATDSGADAAGQ